MKNIEEINQTSDALLSIIDYCKHNNLVFWSEHKSYHYRMYVGGRSHFEDQSENSDYGAFEITPDFIKEEKLNLKFIPAEQNKTCSLQLWNPWFMQDTENHAYHLFFHCINSTHSGAIYKSLFDSFIPKDQPFKINNVLSYGNIVSKNKIEMDKWNKILKILTPEELENFWNDKVEVNLVSILLQKISNKNDVKKFLENMLGKYPIQTDNVDNDSLNFTNLVLENFSNNEHLEYYSKKYPFINQLLNKKDFFDLFSNNQIVEKSVINNFELSHIYPINGSNLKKHTTDIILISQEISNHSKLKEIGLIEIDAVEKNHNTCFYLNIEKNSIFNKNHFENILKNVIEFFHEKNNSDDIKQTVDSFVQKWYLEHQLPDKRNGIRKNKL